MAATSNYLYKIYDTISVRNSRVGFGTDVPQGTLQVVGPAFFNQIGSVNSNIDFLGSSLSNIITIKTRDLAASKFAIDGIAVDYITTNNISSNIDLYGKSLSNIASISTQVVTSDGSTINMSGKTLSNVATISTSKLTSFTDAINVDAKSLSNVSAINVRTISSPTALINFNSSTLSNVRALYVSSDTTIGGNLTASNLTIVGDFTVLNTTTSNMEQVSIINTGTGPALKVVQIGVGSQYPIADFVDNEAGSALYIADTGIIGVGTTIPAYRMDVFGQVAVRDVMYMKTGGMNKIHYGFGNILSNTTGSQTLSVDMQWTNVTILNRYAFRVMAKLHVVSDRPSAAYRKLEAMVCPADDIPNNRPCQLSVSEQVDSTNADFGSFAHTITRRDGKTVRLTFTWNSSIQPAIANVELEIFANELLGNFTFTPVV